MTTLGPPVLGKLNPNRDFGLHVQQAVNIINVLYCEGKRFA